MTAKDARPDRRPAQHSHLFRAEVLLLAVAAGPFGWILQLVADYALASTACRPSSAPRPPAPTAEWGGEHLLLLGINLACLAICLAGGAIALTAWTRTRGNNTGGVSGPIDIVEERIRFMARCGVMAAAGFALAILFDTTLPFLAPSCWRFA